MLLPRRLPLPNLTLARLLSSQYPAGKEGWGRLRLAHLSLYHTVIGTGNVLARQLPSASLHVPPL